MKIIKNYKLNKLDEKFNLILDGAVNKFLKPNINSITFLAIAPLIKKHMEMSFKVCRKISEVENKENISELYYIMKNQTENFYVNVLDKLFSISPDDIEAIIIFIYDYLEAFMGLLTKMSPDLFSVENHNYKHLYLKALYEMIFINHNIIKSRY
jgi:hypothetical protein